MFNLNNKIYSNNNNLLLGIINDLQQINNITHDNLVIKRIGDIIIKMNFIIKIYNIYYIIKYKYKILMIIKKIQN